MRFILYDGEQQACPSAKTRELRKAVLFMYNGRGKE